MDDLIFIWMCNALTVFDADAQVGSKLVPKLESVKDKPVEEQSKAIADYVREIAEYIVNSGNGKFHPLAILKNQLVVLQELLPRYTGRTLDNVLQNIEVQVKELEKKYDMNQFYG